MSQSTEITVELFEAVHVKNNVDKIKECLKKGADVNIPELNHQRYTALHIACRQGFVDSVEYLIANNANVNAVAKGKVTPLHLATEAGCQSVVKLLLENGAKPNETTSENYGNATPLHWLLKSDSPNDDQNTMEAKKDIIRLLKEYGAKLDEKNCDDETALHLACCHEENVEYVKELLKFGANRNVLNKENNTPLSKAKICCGPTSPVCKAFDLLDPTNQLPIEFCHGVNVTGIVDPVLADGSNPARTTQRQAPVILNLTVKDNAKVEIHQGKNSVANVGDNAKINQNSN